MKIMKKRYIRLLLFGFILFNLKIVSAQDNTIYWMNHLPQSINTNPAKQSDCKFFLDLPIIPNFSVDLAHSGFTINDAFKAHPTIPNYYMLNFDGIEAALNEKNSISSETNISIINLGIGLSNDKAISFGINYKVSESFLYPKALIELRKGNYRENGTPLSFNFGQDLLAYREIYIGFSKKLNGNLNLGGRLKYLSGYANIKTKSMKIDWYTSTLDDGMYDWTFNSDFDIRTSTPFEWEFAYDSLGHISGFEYDDTYFDNILSNTMSLIFPRNAGLAVDMGVEYNLNERITLSASVTDFGFIKWKTNPNKLTQQASYTFSGLDVGKYITSIESLQNDFMTEMIDDLTDTLLTVFDPAIEKTAYSSGLNTKFFAGGNVLLTDWLNFGLLYRGAILNKTLFSAYTVSANMNFMKGWAYSLTYSIKDGLANNVGMGIAYKVGPFQMYLITDNLSAPFWAINETEFSDTWLRNTKRINLSFGVNFILCGHKDDIGLLE